jgi:LEA14-like dessication related protein
VRHFHFPTIAIAVFCAFIAAACSSIDKVVESAPKPGARILGATIRDLRLNSLDLLFDVEVSNPYAVALPLLDLSYTLGSGQQQLLAGSIKPSGSVPANGTSIVQLPARLDLGAVLKTLPGVKPGAVVPYTAKLIVIVEPPLLGPMQLPLQRSGELPIPAIPEITLSSFEVGDLGVDQISGKARLRVKNTNQFTLDLSQLRVDLTIAGRKVASTRTNSSSRLGPGRTAAVDIPVTLSPGAATAALADLLGGGDTSYAISGRLDARTRFGDVVLPFGTRGETTVRQR